MKNSTIRSIFILLVVTFGVGVQSTFACRCVQAGKNLAAMTEKAFTRSNAVFVAKVVGFEFRRGIAKPNLTYNDPLLANPDKFETKVVKFEFENIWKGSESKIVFATNELKTDSGMTISSSCDFDFEAGARYLVFASESQGVLRSSLCTGTRKLTGSPDDEAILGFLSLQFCLPEDPDQPGLQMAVDYSLPSVSILTWMRAEREPIRRIRPYRLSFLRSRA